MKFKQNEPTFFDRAFTAKEVGVKPTTIKHWEREIAYIDKRIKRSLKGNRRLYNRENIEQFREVKRLMEEERLSVEEVANYFKNGLFNKPKDDNALDVKTDLDKKTEALIIVQRAISKLEKLKELI